jgi:hypothetical protein
MADSATRRKVKLRLDDAAARDIDYLADRAGLSRQAVIIAALIHAKAGKWRPDDFPGDAGNAEKIPSPDEFDRERH